MTDTPETPLAARIAKLQARARAPERPSVAKLTRILADALDLLAELDAARPPPGALTPEELERALGGAQFLGNLDAMLRQIGDARRDDAARVLEYLFRHATAPQDAPIAPGYPAPPANPPDAP